MTNAKTTTKKPSPKTPHLIGGKTELEVALAQRTQLRDIIERYMVGDASATELQQMLDATSDPHVDAYHGRYEARKAGR